MFIGYSFSFSEAGMDSMERKTKSINNLLGVFLQFAASGKYAEASEVLEDVKCAYNGLVSEFEGKRRDAAAIRRSKRWD